MNGYEMTTSGTLPDLGEKGDLSNASAGQTVVVSLEADTHEQLQHRSALLGLSIELLVMGVLRNEFE